MVVFRIKAPQRADVRPKGQQGTVQTDRGNSVRWIADTEKDAASTSLKKRLWDAAGQFRTNSGLEAQEYSGPILGLVFLRFAEVRFVAQRAKLGKAGVSRRPTLTPDQRSIDPGGRFWSDLIQDLAVNDPAPIGGQSWTPIHSEE